MMWAILVFLSQSKLRWNISVSVFSWCGLRQSMWDVG